ncbi:MAG: RagB/SusD family nutrient uptake outer membrane protein [Bacteroidetes bacterium]|nr:RagB/SusD family nutrient uptake outer membrane protein [Bacteroidota bacterium]
MKKIKYTAILFITLFSLSNCNKKLDVVPQQNITPDQITTADDVKALLFGEYSLMQNANGFGERLIFIPDLLADEKQVDFVGTFTNYKDFFTKTQDKQNSIPAGIWSNMYLVLNLSNTVLSKISLIDPSEQDEITGEAEFMRGVALFELVKLFGLPYSAGNISTNPGVPIILDPPKYVYDPANALVSRASVGDVYVQVLKDLQDAANKLPTSQDDNRADQYAAKAFLSQVYMQMGDYVNAATMANDVISSGKYNLVSTFNQAFNNVSNSQEDVFAIQQSAQSNAGTSDNGLTTFYSPAPQGRGDAQVDAGYKTFFENGDFRKTYTQSGSSIGGFSGKYTLKWADFYKAVPVIRLAEMYLTRGEANLRKGGAPIGGIAPLDDINKVRQRSGATPLLGVTGNDFVEERMRELGFEGDRLWTLKRLQMDVSGLLYTDNKLVLPIPQREIEVNSNLVQNPGY